MKKLTSLTLVLALILSMLTFSVTVSGENAIDGEVFYNNSLFYRKLLKPSIPYSFVAEGGKLNTLACVSMSDADFIREIAKYHAPSELYEAFADATSSGELEYEGLNIYYEKEKTGILDESDFPELDGVGWARFIPSNPDDKSEVLACGFRLDWDEAMSAEEIDVYVDLLEDRLGKDLLWIDPAPATRIGMPQSGRGTDVCFLAFPDDMKLGNLNCDDSINLKDVVLLTQYLSGWDVETNGNADFYYDGEVNMIDVVSLIRYTAGLI